MEKYGQPNDVIIMNLRNEEAQLMCQIQNIMNSPEKRAEHSNLSHLESRLCQVRNAITEFDLKDMMGREF